MENELDELRRLLKEVLPAEGGLEPRGDLWPAVLRRVDAGNLRADWLDWALLAGLGISAYVFPPVVLALLYHL